MTSPAKTTKAPAKKATRAPRTSTAPAAPPDEERSLGQLVAAATQDLSLLMRQEVELAKLEIKRDVVNAGKGAGAFGAAGFAGVLALVFLSAGAAYGIGEALEVWAGFVIVGAVYLVAAAVVALVGKKSLAKVGPPEHTIETVKDDIAWAKHPTKAPGSV